MEDLNEANSSHLLINLSNTKDFDAQDASTLFMVHELLAAINFTIFNINKKSKKNSKSTEQHPVVHHAASAGREFNRR
ncbi:hypothetical protein [Vaccinia virus]|uniref:Protein OPG157 n=1 Tax=Vaccinia virus TaxID=10245 RepID=A0A2I6J1H8_VACCV|nr:hypothetical protein [Vaccinia virus]